MASMLDLNSENAGEVTSRKGIVLVDCWAPWCRNCDGFSEAYRAAASKYPRHLFASLDTQDQKDLRSALGIHHIPSLIVFRDGVLLFKQPGSFDEATLENIIAQAESVDMEEVRAELASAKDPAE